MKCPACKDVPMTAHELEAHLPSKRCPVCHGQWIKGTVYFRWLEKHSDVPAGEGGEAGIVAPDSGAAKLCPDCGRILTRGKVGHGPSFSIERCHGCGGIWLAANEWEALKAKGLHDDIHLRRVRVFASGGDQPVQFQG